MTSYRIESNHELTPNDTGQRIVYVGSGGHTVKANGLDDGAHAILLNDGLGPVCVSGKPLRWFMGGGVIKGDHLTVHPGGVCTIENDGGDLNVYGVGIVP